MEFLQQARSAGFPGRILIVTAGIDDREAVRLIEAESPVFCISTTTRRFFVTPFRQVHLERSTWSSSI